MKHSLQVASEDWREGGFGLYVHWPYCASKCPYCDFNSHVAKEILHQDWRTAYRHEIERLSKVTAGRVLDSIFLGGGTPSTMEPETVEAIVSAARKAWPTRNTLEVTLEANPTSVEISKFRGFSQAGVNRVSLGVQSLDSEALRLLGRRHSVKDALRAWDIARNVFDRASFDLIYARQHQDIMAWKAELSRALALAPSHLSLYQLTIEDGTAFGDRYKLGKLPGLPSDDAGADLFELTQEMCHAHGLPAYEVSNHASHGQESVHNLIYWRYGDYLGVGPGAHGRLTIGEKRFAQENVRSPDAWLQSVLADTLIHETTSPLGKPEQASEYLMMSLRLREGTDLNRWERLGGNQTDPETLDYLVNEGFLWRGAGRMGTTKRGTQVLNALLRELI